MNFLTALASPFPGLWSAIVELSRTWLPSYLVHSTLFLVGIGLWLALRRPEHRLQEGLLRFALLAGLVTSTLQVGLGVEPLLGRLAFGAEPNVAAREAGELLAPLASAPAPGRHLAMTEEANLAGTISPGLTRPLSLVATLWLAISGLLMAFLVVGHLRLRLRLADRRKLEDVDVVATLARLASGLDLRRPVELSVTDRIGSPISWRVLRPEIVLPTRVVHELESEELEAVLAHELAHIARFDPVWQIAIRSIETLFCLQPFNRSVRSRLEALAEMRCDDLAVEVTGRPVALARTLTRVADWQIDPCEAACTNAFAARRSGLGRRIRRLLDEPTERRSASLRRAWILPLALVAIAVFVVPVFSETAPLPPLLSSVPAPASAPLAPLPIPPQSAHAPLLLSAPYPATAPTPPEASSALSPASVPQPSSLEAQLAFEAALAQSRRRSISPELTAREREDLAAALEQAARELRASSPAEVDRERLFEELARLLDLSLRTHREDSLLFGQRRADEIEDRARAQFEQARHAREQGRRQIEAELEHAREQALQAERQLRQQFEQQQEQIESELREKARARVDQMEQARDSRATALRAEAEELREQLEHAYRSRELEAARAMEALERAYAERLRAIEAHERDLAGELSAPAPPDQPAPEPPPGDRPRAPASPPAVD